MTVLVTDGNERAALAVTRALGERGVRVVVGAETVRSLAGASRYCQDAFAYPSPLVNPDAFAAAVIAEAGAKQVEAVFPISDAALQFLADRQGNLLSSATMPIPSADAYHLVSDKARLVRQASELGLPVPRTVSVLDGNVEAVMDQIREFPVVVKPARSLTQTAHGWVKTSVRFANSADELRSLYRTSETLRQPSLIQERIQGPGQGIFALFDRGQPVALFAHRRVREKPPSGGVSVVRESIELPKRLADDTVRLLQSVHWHGVAMVEFKLDQTTGMPYLMEVNGRFWGSLQLAVDAGLNFPFLLYEISQGRTVGLPTPPYRVGVRSRWFLGDVDHLLLRLRKSDAELNLPAGSPSRLACLREFFRVYRGTQRYEVERWTDPGPALFEYRQYLRDLMKGVA